MKFFQKDLRKEYLKMTGIKYGREEEKEIKSMLKSEMPLEIFKLCVTPMIDERKLKEIGNSHIELKKIAETNTLIYLKAEQMKELKRGYEAGLKYEEIELYKKADLTSKDMQKARENIQEIKKESDFFKENIVAQNIFGQKNQETSENKPSFINSDFSKENSKNNYLNDENKRSDFFKSNLDNENTSFKNLHNDNKNMSTFFVENPKTDPEVRKAEQIETIKREEKEKKEKDKPTALEEENIRINTKRMNNAKIIPNVTGNAVMYTGLAAISRAETINSLVSNGSKGVSDIKAAINNFKNAENKSRVIEFEDGKGGKGKIELDTSQTAETKKTGEGIFGEVKKASHVKFLNPTETKQIQNDMNELRTSKNEGVIFKTKNIQSSEKKEVKVTEKTIDKTR